MRQVLVYSNVFIAVAVLATGCLTQPKQQQQLEHDAQAYINAQQQEQQQFTEQYSGGQPAEVLQQRYDEFVQRDGEPSDTITNSVSPSFAVAKYVAEQLDLPYAQLAYVQYESGTFGLQSLLETMDQTVDTTATVTLQVKGLNAIDDPAFYQANMPDGLSDQEQAAYIVQTAAQHLRVFYPTADVTPIQQDVVNQLVVITGLSKDDLAVLEDQYRLESVLEILPDSLAYKSQALTLLASN